MACAVQALTHYQTYLEALREPSCIRKKVNNLGPMGARSRKIRKLPEEPPVVVIAVSLDPTLPQ